ncbi:FecR domain-containing protein [Pigmentiphaga litoralis]|uniref:FecR domain-containing protein n=1 Tax=Pigmentiphaga litoralis TaxID=516702 RepID=UPI003B42CC30
MSDSLRDTAIAWKVRLQSGAASAAEFKAFARWRDADPAHARAWDRLQHIGNLLTVMPPCTLRSTLARADADRARSGRRAVLKSLWVVGGTAIGAGASWSGYRWLPWQDLVADYHTAVGEQAEVTLDDASRVTLNTNTAISVHMDAGQRGIELLRGEILLRVGGHGRRQMLDVRDPAGGVSATEGRFAVRRTPVGTRVAVYDGQVRIACAQGASAVLQAGSVACFTSSGVGPPAPLSDGDGAWTDGVIVAQGMRLGDLVAELSRYRVGLVHCTDDVAGQRISGVYPVGNTDHALDAITRVLPVAVHRRTRYWITVTAA